MGIKRIRDPKLLAEITGSNCVICGKVSDAAHIKSRGAGGDDVPTNLIALCRWHHQLQHAIGWARFVLGWPVVGDELKKRGWEIRREFGVLRLRRVEA